MTNTESRNHAKSFLRKAQEYLDAAQDSLDLERATPAAGDAIHAGISAKDAIVTALTGETSKAKDHAKAVKELRQALGAHRDAAAAEKALRELISMKGEVEYGATLITLAKAKPLVRRAETLVKLAKAVVTLHRAASCSPTASLLSTPGKESGRRTLIRDHCDARLAQGWAKDAEGAVVLGGVVDVDVEETS